MTEDDLRLIESRLEICLPDSYRALHHDRADLLQKLDWPDAATLFYLTAEGVIDANLEERQPDMGTACAFPNWWETFVLIGTAGDGDFYALRLDNGEGVWLIGYDWEKPKQVADALQQYIEQRIAEHAAAKALEAERTRRRVQFQTEIDAHLAVIAGDHAPRELVPAGWVGAGSPLAAEWVTCTAIYPMFEWLKGLDTKVSPRKLRLYGLALCQLIPGVEDDSDCAAGVAMAKAMTLGNAPANEISQMRARLRNKVEHLMKNYRSFDPEAYRKTLWRTNAVHCLFQDDDGYLSDAAIYPNDPDLTMVYSAAGHAVAGYPYGVEQAPDLLREVLGNPFLPVAILPQWQTPEVVNLAQSIHQNEEFDRLPELGLTLAQAGCVDSRVLAHCERPNSHVRGCWVVDAILGNQ